MTSLKCADLLNSCKIRPNNKNQVDTSGLFMHSHLCMSVRTSMCNCARVPPVVLRRHLSGKTTASTRDLYWGVAIHKIIWTFYFPASVFPLCSLWLSFSQSFLTVCDTPSPGERHQFRWASYVTGQLCLFKPLSVPLHPPPYTFSTLFCVCARTPSCCRLAICVFIYIANTVLARVRNWQVYMCDSGDDGHVQST